MSDMNVGSVSGVYSAISTSTPVVSDSAASAAQTPAANTADVAAVYEKSEGAANKATYSINKMSAEDRAALVERIETRKGLRQLTYMKELRMGTDEYVLIDTDNNDEEISVENAVKDVVPWTE